MAKIEINYAPRPLQKVMAEPVESNYISTLERIKEVLRLQREQHTERVEQTKEIQTEKKQSQYTVDELV